MSLPQFASLLLLIMLNVGGLLLFLASRRSQSSQIPPGPYLP